MKDIGWYTLRTDAGTVYVYAYDKRDGFEARIQLPREDSLLCQSAVVALGGHLIRRRARAEFGAKH